jgi:response regulator RpfG family c-di-GMP phosphodiesterase
VQAKILFVDDEQNILDTMRRNLGRRYAIDTALGPEQALSMIRQDGPYAVVVSDQRMPGISGVQLLGMVRQISPVTVRVMLTGYADLGAAMAAVNEGNVFRFLAKPCPTEDLIKTLEAALEQYRLVTAEKELLRGTLRGCVKVLTEILSLVNPEAFGRAERIRRLMLRMAADMGLAGKWKLELAAMLSQIGCVSVPEEIISKKYTGKELSPEELQIYSMHTSVAVSLLENIPRMEEIAAIIGCQEQDDVKCRELPQGALLLRAAVAYDDLAQAGLSKKESVERLKSAPHKYGSDVVEALERAVFRDEGYLHRKLPVFGLQAGMILSEDLRSTEGLLILAMGQELSDFILGRLRRMALGHILKEPVEVLAPIEQ